MDALIEAINLSKTVHPGDIALLMDVDERALRYAVQLLTGMTLKDILHHEGCARRVPAFERSGGSVQE